MNYLLDTCVISELIKPAPNSAVVKWLNETPSEQLFLPTIAVGEIRKGIVKLPDSKRKQRLIQWLNHLINDYQDNIIPIDLAVAETWGRLQGQSELNGRPLATIDGLISATAVANCLTVVTRNEKDFPDATVLNPWL